MVSSEGDTYSISVGSMRSGHGTNHGTEQQRPTYQQKEGDPHEPNLLFVPKIPRLDSRTPRRRPRHLRNLASSPSSPTRSRTSSS